MFDSISFLPKVNNSCFLDCSYCMVQNEQIIEGKNKLPSTVMDLSLIEQMCNKSLGYNKWFFSYLGGEPLMNGTEWFEQMFQIVERKSKEMFIPYTHRVTTNGLLLDDEWIELLKKYNCKIIYSYDGLGNGKKGSKKGHDILVKYAKDIHVVQSVVTTQNCDKLIEMYKEYNDAGIKYFSTQFDIYANEEEHIQFGEAVVKLFEYIDSLPRSERKTSYFVYNDAKAMASNKLASLNSGDFLNNRIVSDYVIDHDGEVRNALNARLNGYAHYGKLQDLDHFNDILFTGEMQKVLRDYVNAIKAFGDLEEVSLMTRGGGYPGDRYGIRREDAPHTPKLRCYKLLLDYFRQK